MAWDYGRYELQCLCASCHETETNTRDRLAETIASLSFDELEQLAGYAEGLFCLKLTGEEEIALGRAVRSANEFEGLCDAMHLSFSEALPLCTSTTTRLDFIELHKKH